MRARLSRRTKMKSTTPSVKIPVFVIAFPDPAARQEIREHFATIGIEPCFFDAIPGANLSGEQREPFLTSGREYQFKGPLRDGAMGCSLAHFGVWQAILDEGIEAAVVLEDDAVAKTDSRNDIASRLNTLYQQRNHLDLVFLHRRWDRPFVRVDGSKNGEPGLILPRYSDLGAVRYFITASCARYLLSRPEKFRAEVDKYLQHWWHHDPEIRIVGLWPALFEFVGRRPSLIGYDNEPRFKFNPLHHILMRRVNRLVDSARKRAGFRGRVTRLRRHFSAHPIQWR